MIKAVRIVSFVVMVFGLSMTLIAETGSMPNITEAGFIFALGLLVFIVNELEGLG